MGFPCRPHPTDRGESGTKHHVVVQAQGLPLLATHTVASEHDGIRFDGLVAALSPIAQPAGYRRKHPDKGYADKVRDLPCCCTFLLQHGIAPHTVRSGVASSSTGIVGR